MVDSRWQLGVGMGGVMGADGSVAGVSGTTLIEIFLSTNKAKRLYAISNTS